MANKKISQLTQANLPLVGTEELPIVQGGQTVKVRVQDIVGSSGVTEVTYTALQSLITSSSLVPGSTYKITGFNKNMPNGSPENPNGNLPVVLYDDGTNSGTTIYLQAVTNNTLSESGYGEFYNPKYTIFYDVAFNPSTVEGRSYLTFRDSYNNRVGENILDGEFTILHSLDSGNYYLINFTSWTQGNAGGGFSYTRQLITPEMDEPVISFTKTNGGSQVDIIEPGVLEITRGNNNVIYNAALESSANSDISPEGTEWSRNGMAGFYGIWDGDNPENTPSYQEDQVVFWGGYAWKNLTGGVGFADNILTLNSDDWEKLPYTDTNHYEKVIDEIKVDLSSGILIGRTNVENQITVEFSKDYYSWESPSDNNPISEMGWGLYPGYVNNDDLYGINSVKSINSRCVTVNFKGRRFFNIDLNLSYVINNYFGRGTYFESNTLTDYSYINNNTLTNNSYIYYNTLSNSSYIDSNTLTNYSEIYGNTLITSNYIQNNTLSNNCYINNNTLSNDSYIQNNTLNENGIIQSNTLTNNSNIQSNTLTDSDIRDNTLTNNSNIQNNTLTDRYIQSNTLTDNSNIQSNTLNDSVIDTNTLTNSSYIINNTLNENGYIQNNTLNDISYIENNTLSDYAYIRDNKLTLSSYVSFNVISGATIDESTIDAGIAGNVIQSSSISSNTITITSLIEEGFFEVIGIVLNKIYGLSEIDNNTLDTSFISLNELNSIAAISNNQLIINSFILGNILNNESGIINCVFDNFGRVFSIKLIASTIDLTTSGTLVGVSLGNITIKNTTIDEDLSSATDIFLFTEKEIFTRLDGTKRLMYYNTSDTPTIVNVNA